MPTYDENGNMIGMDGFPICDADGNPVRLSAATVLQCAPDVEHDYLPPLDYPQDMTFSLTKESAMRLLEFIERDEKGQKWIGRRARWMVRHREQLRRLFLKGEYEKAAVLMERIDQHKKETMKGLKARGML